MAILDISLTEGDNTLILEKPSGGLNAPADMLAAAGDPQGPIEELAAGTLNAPSDMLTDRWLVKNIKLPDCSAA